MSDDYGAINGEQINFYAIDDGNAEIDIEIFHNLAFDQTIVAVRGRSLATGHDFTFDQSLQLRAAQGMDIVHPFEFNQDVDVFQLYPIVVRHTVAIGLEGDLEHVAFNRWRSRERLRVRDDFRGMFVEQERRFVSVPPDPEPAPRDMRATPELRRIVVPPEPVALVRQRNRVILA